MRIGEQPAAPVAIVANAPRDSRQPCQQRRFECVLQQDRAIEALAPERLSGAPLSQPIACAAAAVERDDPIGEWFALVKVRDPGPRQNRDMGFGESRPDRFKRGQAHHRVAHPVGGANQDAGKIGYGFRLRQNTFRQAAEPSLLSRSRPAEILAAKKRPYECGVACDAAPRVKLFSVSVRRTPPHPE